MRWDFLLVGTGASDEDDIREFLTKQNPLEVPGQNRGVVYLVLEV